jgi:hypothetical protein
MRPQRIAGLCLCFVVSSVAAGAQQGTDINTPPRDSGRVVTEHSYPISGFLPFRRVERRTESGGRKVIIEAVEAPGVEGTWRPLEQVVTETTRTRSGGPARTGRSDTTRTQRDVIRFDFDRRPRVAETTQSEQETRPNATTNVERTWVADLDGHLILSTGYSEQRRVASPGLQQTEATVLLQGPERSLREVERTESTDHQVSPADLRHDSTHFVRDVLNGRWVPVETRSGLARGVGPAERVEEETIQRPNLNGTLVLSDKVVTRTSESNGENRVVIETYSQNAEGFVRSDSHLALRQRVSRSTTATADGGQITVEETEERNPMAPNDPMHVTRRTVVTVRSSGRGGWVTERQMFERDQNGRMFLVTKDTQVTTEK